MSKVSIQGDVSGTGDFTIKAPNSNTDRTLTLPDEAGTVATIENIPPGYEDQDALDLFNATGSAPVYACRAWVNFDGTGTVSIRESGNVSSITDNGTGKYTVNLSNAMPDDNYCVTVNHAEDNPSAQYSNFGAGSRAAAFNNNPDRTTTAFSIATEVDSSGFTDMRTIEAMVVR